MSSTHTQSSSIPAATHYVTSRCNTSRHFGLLALVLGLLLAGCNSATSDSAYQADSGADTPQTPAAGTPVPLDSAIAEAEANDAPANAAQANATESATGSNSTTVAAPPPAQYADGAAAAREPDARDGMYNDPPPMLIEPDRYYYATLKTEKGDIRIQLFADRAPLAVNNFIFLAREGFYNDTTFHRVIDGFMAQAGDPTGTGSGGPGYTFEDEFHPGLAFDQAGLVAMANSGVNTNGSQFFITYAPTDWLDFKHTIFGKVIEGEDVLASISLRDPAHQPDTPGDTLYTVIIEESDSSHMPTPTPMPPTPTPTPTPTPFAPTQLALEERPLADLPPVDRVNYFNQPPATVIESAETYTATIVTSSGDLVVALATDSHPTAVNNFIVLAQLGFYDDTPISLVRPDDSIIFGVPDNNPLNDAGYKFPAEIGVGEDPEFGSIAYIPFETQSDGTILSSSSQILIALIQPAPQFKQQLSFFGKIVEGQTLLNGLSMEDTIETIHINDADGPLGTDSDATSDSVSDTTADTTGNTPTDGEPDPADAEDATD